MADDVITIPKANDKQILAFFASLEKEHEFSSPTIRIQGSDENVVPGEIFKGKRESKSIWQVTINKPGTTITFQRGALKRSPTGHTHVEPSYAFDHIKLQGSGLSPAEAVIINDLISKNFLDHPSAALLKLDEGSVLKDAVTTHHQVVARLEEAMASIGERFVAARVDLEQEFEQKRRQQEELLAERMKALEETRSAMTADLDAERQKLRAREQQLDDRDNTHVRRELRDQFKQHLASYKEAFAFTKGTRQLRLPIHVATVLSFTVIVLGIWFFATQPLPPEGWAYVAYLVKPLGLTVAAVGLMTWYLRWMTHWSDRHADAEFQLKQLELDMDRASWVVETAFEWKNREENAIPDHPLQAVSRNLFTRVEQNDDTSANPMDQLASALLGQAAHAKLNIAGNEIEFGRRALRQAGREEQ
jgi:hypothetical protein